MRIVVFNDTRVGWMLHAHSERGINDETRIPAHSAVTFEGPGGSEPFIKCWAKMVMVCFDGSAMVLASPHRRRFPPRGRRSRMPSDEERMNIEASASLYGTVRDLGRGG